MTNRAIIGLVVGILVAGLVLLGIEVKDLRAEVTQLSGSPLSALTGHQKQLRSSFTPPDSWWFSSNNRWDPYSELEHIQKQMNRLLDESFSGGLWRRGIPVGDNYDLSTDIKDTKDKYVINMDIPGMEKDNIDVEVRNNTLLVSGERKNENEEKNANYYKQERSFGYFSQSLPLPQDADSSAIAVNYNKGVLKIEIPKLAKANSKQQESTRIAVN